MIRIKIKKLEQPGQTRALHPGPDGAILHQHCKTKTSPPLRKSSKNTRRQRPAPAQSRPGGARLSLGLLLLPFLGTLSGARAQGVLTPPSEIYEKPAAAYALTTNVNVGIPPLAGAPARGPFQWGVWDFHPHLLYRFIYGDGIPAGPTNHYKTIIQEISPGLLLNMGDHWLLDYTPTFRLIQQAIPRFHR